MRADGSIIIDTRIRSDGMDEGAQRIKKGLSSVGDAADKAAGAINKAFSRTDVSAPIARAAAQVKRLEEQLSAVSSEYSLAVSDDDDKAAERLARQRVQVYDRLEAAREKLASEVARAAQKEAEAEERASRREAKAAEKRMKELTKPVRRFSSRLQEIASGALVFNAISAGLRKVTDYFGSALNASDEYSSALARLRGSLLTAFQPIYNAVLPAIISLINWLNTAAQVIGKFFATLTGRSYSEIQKNAEALDQQAAAVGGVGDAAEKAAKQLMKFDEINKLESVKNASGGGGGSSVKAPVFEELEIPETWETAVESLSMRIKDIFFRWDNLSPEIMVEKLIAALTTVLGGVAGFVVGGVPGALIGITVGAGLGVTLTNVLFNGDGVFDTEEIIKSLVAVLSIAGGALIGFVLGGPGGAALGATIGLGLTFVIESVFFGDVEEKFSELRHKITEHSDGASEDIIKSFRKTERETESVYLLPTQRKFKETAKSIEDSVAGAAHKVTNSWYSIPDWFARNITQPIEAYFNGLSEAIGAIWDGIAASIGKAVEEILGFFSRFAFIGGETITYPRVYSAVPTLSAYSVTPEIPHLAHGAVIPPNNKFLAVLGDQTSGVNVEAPLATIQDAVQAVIGGELYRTNELLAQILNKDTDVYLDGRKVAENTRKHLLAIARATGE